MIIGIDGGRDNKESAFYRKNGSTSYGYWSDGSKCDENGKWTQYSCGFAENDEVVMVLNMDNNRLCFGVNGGAITTAFVVDQKTKYFMAVWLGYGASVTLLSYEFEGGNEEKVVF